MISVLKYGGSSVADTKKIIDIADYLKTRVEKGEKLVVVLSAMGKETDELIDLAKELCEVPSGRELDQLLSLGENKSVSLMALRLNSIGVKAKSLVGDKTGIYTYGEYQNSKISKVDTTFILNQLNIYEVLVVAGFQGVNHINDVTTLGRGGSDTTAVALACALGVECEIYTDVAGIYNTDPRICSLAKKLDIISYEDMCELSSLGANVMHNRSIRLASQHNTRVYVGKSLDSEKGTFIVENNYLEKNRITGISVEKEVSHFLIKFENRHEIKENIFNLLVEYNVNFDMLSQENFSDMATISFVVNTANKLEEKLKRVEGVTNVTLDHYSKISLVGTGLRDNVDVFSRITKLFKSENSEFYQLSTSDISMSLLTDIYKSENIIDKLIIEFNI